MYIEKSLKSYLDDLAAKKPAPGGGSVSAMVAASGVALISMAANFTISKEKYKHIESKMRELLSKSENLRSVLMKLVDEDVKVYQKLSDIYKASKRKDFPRVQKALKEAASIPLKICRFSVEAMRLCPLLVKEGNANLISDIGVAVHFLNSAFFSAKIFVEINLKTVKDKEFIVKIREILESLQQEIDALKKQLTRGLELEVRGSLADEASKLPIA